MSESVRRETLDMPETPFGGRTTSGQTIYSVLDHHSEYIGAASHGSSLIQIGPRLVSQCENGARSRLNIVYCTIVLTELADIGRERKEEAQQM